MMIVQQLKKNQIQNLLIQKKVKIAIKIKTKNKKINLFKKF